MGVVGYTSRARSSFRANKAQSAKTSLITAKLIGACTQILEDRINYDILAESFLIQLSTKFQLCDHSNPKVRVQWECMGAWTTAWDEEAVRAKLRLHQAYEACKALQWNVVLSLV